MTKKCIRCNSEKDISEFNKNKKLKDGLQFYCRKCQNKINVNWNHANVDRVRETSLDWHYRNYKDDPEKFRKRSSEWKKGHREQVNKANTAYRDLNRDKVRIWDKNWYYANPEKAKTNHSVAHGKRRALLKGSSGKISSKEWREVLSLYGNKCLCCGSKDNLAMDHVIPIIIGGKNEVDNVQPLCKFCNSRKKTQTTDYRFNIGHGDG